MNSAQVCIGIIQISYPEWQATVRHYISTAEKIECRRAYK